ncbi:MAG: DUF4350 domain-containing protein [Flavitalea sp.]
MKKFCTYRLLLPILLMVSGCGPNKRLNERVSLWRNDKIPYGTYYAYENLSRIFPDASIEITKKSPDKYKGLNFGEAAESYLQSDGKSAHIIISPQVLPDESELRALFNYVGEGNHIFISSFHIGKDLLDSLHLKPATGSGYSNYSDSLTVTIANPVTYASQQFSYPGKALDNAFLSVDTSITNILGRNERGEINYVRITYESGGSVNIQLAPMAFTNFFLLHKDNKGYYDNALSYLPKDIEVVKWDDYFRNRSGNNNSNFSKLSVFLNNDILKWAFWLVITLFAIIYLFESKRKQNIVPVIPPIKNASLDFVKTIGRLYYQRKDNKNLAMKMSAHFLDYVRNRFNLPTSVLNDEFENKLAYKSDYDRTAIRDIVYVIKTLPDQLSITDEELLAFNEKLQKFINHH